MLEKVYKGYLKQVYFMDIKPSPTPAIPNLPLSSNMAPKDPKEIEVMQTIPYREMLGILKYMVSCTRPDLYHIIGYLSWFMQNPSKPHRKALSQVF